MSSVTDIILNNERTPAFWGILNVTMMVVMIVVLLIDEDDHGDINEPLNYVSLGSNGLLFLYTLFLVLFGREGRNMCVLTTLSMKSLILIIINALIIKL